MHGARAGHLGVGPRDGRSQRPVDLEGAVAVLEVPDRPPHPTGNVGRVEQIEVQRGCAHVGQHRPPHRHGVARRRAHACGTSGPHDHLGHGRTALDPSTLRLEPPHQGGGELTGAAHRDGPAHLLRERGQQPPVDGAAGRLGQQVGVERVAAEQQRTPLALEAPVRLAPGRAEAELQQVDEAPRSREAPQPDRRAHRWERREQRVEQGRRDAVEEREQGAPGVAVAAAGREPVEGGGRDVEVGVDDQGRAVGRRVGQRARRRRPLQAVAVEVERPERRGHGRERVEGAVEVGREPRGGHLGAAHRAARLRCRFEHQHVPPVIGQHVGRHQPVRAGADHDRVDVARPVRWHRAMLAHPAERARRARRGSALSAAASQ